MPDDDIPVFDTPEIVPPLTSEAKPLDVEYKLLRRNAEPFLKPEDLDSFPSITVCEEFALKFENEQMRIWLNKARNFVQIETVDGDGNWGVCERYN